MKQNTKNIMMIKPRSFGFNFETSDNVFQTQLSTEEDIASLAGKEFDQFVLQLKSYGVNVIVIDDKEDVIAPDSVFPNNWVSMHHNGNIFTYEMATEVRKVEVRHDIFKTLKNKGFKIYKINDWTKGFGVLEGTGAFVFDHPNKIAYLSISQRASFEAAKKWCKKMNYKLVAFNSSVLVKGKETTIYHTNVMLCVAKEYAIVCLDVIKDQKQRQTVLQSLKNTNKEIIEITLKQVWEYAGNALQVLGKQDKPFLVLSNRAWNSLNQSQQSKILSFNEVIKANVDTIETVGGGSARCMLTEIFLPLTTNSN